MANTLPTAAVRDGDPLALTSVGWPMAHGIPQLLIDGQLAIINGGQAAHALITNSDAPAGRHTKRLIDIAVDTMTTELMKTGSD